jgi:hypothetical protein
MRSARSVTRWAVERDPPAVRMVAMTCRLAPMIAPSSSRRLELQGIFSPYQSYAGSRFMTQMPGRSHVGPLPPLSGADAELRERLHRHVVVLAETIGERNLWRYAALQAADYIEQALRTMGWPRRAGWAACIGRTTGRSGERATRRSW